MNFNIDFLKFKFSCFKCNKWLSLIYFFPFDVNKKGRGKLFNTKSLLLYQVFLMYIEYFYFPFSRRDREKEGGGVILKIIRLFHMDALSVYREGLFKGLSKSKCGRTQRLKYLESQSIRLLYIDPLCCLMSPPPNYFFIVPAPLRHPVCTNFLQRCISCTFLLFGANLQKFRNCTL